MKPAAGAIATLLVLSACGDSSTEPNQNDIETNLQDPNAVIESFEKAHRFRDFGAYSALLDEEFQFVPLERDVDDIPWVVDGAWGRTEELEIMGHMFDPIFSGQENPIDAIECDLTPTTTSTLENENQMLIRCSMQGLVLTNANDGWSFDTWIEMTLIQRGPYWRIRRIAEVDPPLRGVGDMQLATWGRIKSFFRYPLPG
jgi:hypothetical protein